MPAKKKPRIKDQKQKQTKANRRLKTGSTTVDSIRKASPSGTTLPSGNMRVPAEQKKPKHMVQVRYPHADRRAAPGSPQPAVAEKAPPGTRTKMLKIIYDHRAEMARKRQNVFVGKIFMAVLIAGSAYFAVQHAWTFTTNSLTEVAESVDMKSWWENVSEKKSVQKYYRPRQR